MWPQPPSSGGIPALPCACASLRRAARAVTQLYEEELRQTGLTGPQFTLLQALAAVESITQGRLGGMLALDSTTLSRTLKPLESKGWIRSRAGDDKRERNLELAPNGRSRLRQAEARWIRAQERLRSAVGGREWADLLASLTRVTRAARQA